MTIRVLGRTNVYVQTRRFNARQIREVVTRDETDAKMVFPQYRDVTTCWEPHDSVHGGKLFLQQQIKGSPAYIECCPPGEETPKWITALAKVEEGLRENFRCSAMFDDDDVEEWEQFLAAMPREGNRSIPHQLLPEFTIPDFPSGPIRLEESHDHRNAMAFLQQAGMDVDGKVRAYYRNGQDLMKYPRDQSVVTYGNRHLNGQKYDAATTGKRKRTGETWERMGTW